MFENYSLADLLANTYKNFKKNIIVALAAFLVVLAPFVLKAVQHKDAVYFTWNKLFYIYCL